MSRLAIASCLAALSLLLAACGGAGGTPPAGAVPGAAPGPSALTTPVWYVIADAGGGGGGNDRLYSVDITLAAPLNAQTAIGAGTGTNNIEGSAFWPGSDTLYSLDSARLGTISLTTGVWTQSVTTDVWNDGNTANIVGLDKNRASESLAPSVLSDIDSVAFDPNTGLAYGVARVGGADILFIFDTGTGHIVRGAFNIAGTPYDYFRVPPVEAGNEDIDDIAIDPYDGQLYGIANGGGLADRLVRIDKATGVASDVGALGVNDMEGFAFYNDSSMWGVTGGGSNTAGDGSSNNNAVFSINRVTGEAYDRRSLTVGGSDFESMAFLTADLNEFCGRVWCDDNGNGTQDPGELGKGGITVVLWRDLDNNDVLDADLDPALVSTVTDGAGDYCFGVASTGDYVITLQADTLPGDTFLTQVNVQPVSVTGFGNTVSGLDFVKTGAVASIGDTVYFDANSNGLQDATEAGLRGVTLDLYDPGTDGICGTGDDVFVATTTTDGGGYYLFTGLADGDYCVDVDETTLPAGATLTTGNQPFAPTITAGGNDLFGDFGYVYPGRIGDLVWLDVDADGVLDAGEPGLGGVDLTLKTPGADGYFSTADDVTVSSTTTAADGSYSFSNLPPGSYSVTVDVTDVPTGATLTTFTTELRLNLRQGQTLRDADFGFVGDASIGDRIWNDTNADGLQDVGEVGIAGVRLDLTEAGPDGSLGTADDIAFPPQVTDASGLYRFPGLVPGTYRVDVDESTLPPTVTSLTSGSEPQDVPLAAATDDDTADFGYTSDDASIGDRVWDDVNGNGVQDGGELGIAGVDLRLLGPGPDGLLGTADDASLLTTTTSGTGAYDFSGLASGSYRVDVIESTLPAGVSLTTGNEPADVVLAPREDYNDADFGYRVAASIGDRIWRDDNGDGVQAASEPGLNGVTVTLVEAGADGTFGTLDDVALGSQVTAGDGDYAFTGLTPGFYRVDVTDASLPAGLVSTTANDPLDELLTAGETFTAADFGYWAPASIGDRVWDDLDGDGVQDAGEPGLDGITVLLGSRGPDGICGTADDGPQVSTVTAGGGLYVFEGVAPGDWCAIVDGTSLPAGYVPTTGAGHVPVTLAPGQDFADADFGFRRVGAIGDRVWQDVDRDGVQDPGEPGLVGVTVSLLGAGPDGSFGTADDLTFTDQVTGVDGAYLFSGLAAGLYRADVDAATVPAGMLLTTANDPLDVTLAAGQGYALADFGFEYVGSIGDRIWQDLDFDGVQDAGEPGLVGVTVDLLGAGVDGLLGTADDVAYPAQTTVADGAYLFDGLPAGTYRMSVNAASVPAGMVLTTANQPFDVTLAAAEDRLDVDVGYQGVGSIGDRVWDDADLDGVQDPGETGLSGVTLDLIEAGPDGLFGTADDDPLGSTVTAADGGYAFTGLPPGLYRVDVRDSTLPPDVSLTGGTDPRDIALAGGQVIDDVDFGYGLLLYTVGDVIWIDSDRDGVYEPLLGERPIPGVLVILRDGTGAVVGTDTTNAAGEYRFYVPPGDYSVEVDPSNFATGGPLHGLTSTGAGTGASATITADNFDLDFGFLGAAAGGRNICGWWSTNTSAWPLTSLTLGGTTYTQAQARAILDHGNLIQASLYGRSAARAAAQVDMSMLVAWALIGAKLNVGAGNDPSAIAATLVAADAWLGSVGFASGIKAGHPSYAAGKTYYEALTTWNAGR